jgi:hypothetical protein
MSLEFASKLRRIKVYPAADGYSLGPEVALLASNESPFGPLPEVVAAAGDDDDSVGEGGVHAKENTCICI